MVYYNVVPNLHSMFQLVILKMENVVLTKIPLLLNFKLKTILEFLSGNLMDDSGLEEHQYLRDV